MGKKKHKKVEKQLEPPVQKEKTAEVTDTKDKSNDHLKRAFGYLFIVLIACMTAGGAFLELREPTPVYPSRGLAKKRMLSDYNSKIRNTRGDTEVLFYEGKKPGGTLFVFGGTHPNEPASNLAAVVMAENLKVNVGRVIIIHRANNSAFTATEPQEAFPQTYSIQNRKGDERLFQVGSRYSNLLDGWPDPTVYRHFPSGQLLSGPETRNLNRAFPGREDGSLTERIAYAITELIKEENVDLVVDLHEAAPEYPVINAIVVHQRAVDVAAMSTVELQMRGIDIQLEVSPENFHGLSHRELGDYTDAHAVLMETAGAMQGRLRGPTDESLIINSIDPLYAKAADLGKLAVPFPHEGIPMEVRVGRHLESIIVLTEIFSEFNPDNVIEISGVPGYEQLNDHGVGFYLK